MSNVYMCSHIEKMCMFFSFMTARLAGFFQRQADGNDSFEQNEEKWQNPSLMLAAEGAGQDFFGRKILPQKTGFSPTVA